MNLNISLKNLIKKQVVDTYDKNIFYEWNLKTLLTIYKIEIVVIKDFLLGKYLYILKVF